MRIADRILPFLSLANERVLKIFGAAALALIGAMSAVILLQVVCRYALNAPLAWPEEAARYMMVWMTFLVLPLAYRNALVVRLEALLERLSEPPRILLGMLLHIIVINTCIMLLVESIWLVRQGAAMNSSALGIRMNFVFAVMPVSFVVTVSAAVERLIEQYSRIARMKDIAAGKIRPESGA